MAIIVPAILGGLAILVMVIVSVVASRNKRKAASQAPKSAQPRILVHSINDDRCVGCDACVAVCPTNVLDLVDNKSRVLRFEDCIQCEACMWACPTEALVMHLEGTEPPPLKVPNIDENFETPVKGQYLIGEVAGKPLVKNSANLGRIVIEHMLRNGLQRGAATSPDPNVRAVDVAIVGSGPSGLSTALACIYHGLSYVVLEKEQVLASTISRYPKGKLVMAEPYDVTNRSFLPVMDSSKEQIIPIWEDLMNQAGLTVQRGEAVESVRRDETSGMFHVKTTVAQYYAQRAVLAIGSRGKPRTLGVQGENLPKVRSLLEDPDQHRGESVLVVGGGDSALEAAIALSDAGAHVSISYRSKGFNRASPKNKATVESYESQRRIDVYFQSQVDHITESAVAINLSDGSQKELPNDSVFTLIGADPPTKWLKNVGVDFVEKPHQFQLGKTDETLVSYLGDHAPICPETAAGAAALLRGETPQEAVPQQEEAGGARKWLKSATQIFAPQRKTQMGMPLGEFANRRHTGDGRRDKLDPAERTRVLRMLRDVGGRMADEDPEEDAGAPESAPLQEERMRQAGLRGVTYPSIDVPKVPGLTQVLDAAGAENAAAAASSQGTVMGMSGPSAHTPSPQQGHGLHAASQLREQAKQQQGQGQGQASFPQEAKTIVEMAVPQELLKHSVGARRKQAEHAASQEQTVVSDPRSFAQDDEKTQFAPPPSMDQDGGGARAGSAPPAGHKKTLFNPGGQPGGGRAPAPQQGGHRGPAAGQQGASQAPAAGQQGSAHQGAGRAPAAQPERGTPAPDASKTLFDAGVQHGEPAAAPNPPAQGEASSRKTLFGAGPQPTAPPHSDAPAPASEDPAAVSSPEEGEGQRDADARRTLRSVNVQFGDEATTAADVSELVRKMSEEKKRRGS